MTAVPPLPPRTGGSAVLKVVAIGVLGICLMVPLTLVWILVAERSKRRDQVVTETVSSIGKAQTAGGVVLDLPYDALERQSNGAVVTVTRHAYVHPEQLTIEATATPEVRHRSLYAVIVYRTTVRLKGTIAPPDLARLNAEPVAVHWDRAVDDGRDQRPARHARGVAADVRRSAGHARADGRRRPVFASGVRGLTPLAPDATAPIPFAVDLTLAGSDALRFVPTGKATDVHLDARPGPIPASAAPSCRRHATTTAQGFEARWQVSYLARSFPHAWLDSARRPHDAAATSAAASTFGVTFVQAVDHYQQTERAVKYGLLFVLLTFTVFLLWELLRNLRLHPVQYLLIGAALVVFYLLLLSLAEHMRFALAYGVAAAATIVLVAAYAASVLAAGAARGARHRRLAVGALRRAVRPAAARGRRPAGRVGLRLPDAGAGHVS